jgi:hypothetical protein
MLICSLPHSVNKIAGHARQCEFSCSHRKTPGICECTRTVSDAQDKICEREAQKKKNKVRTGEKSGEEKILSKFHFEERGFFLTEIGRGPA